MERAPDASGPKKGKRDSSRGPILEREEVAVKTRISCPTNTAGRVLLGPKKLRGGYVRIVSQRDGSGRIESFDPASRTWLLAPQNVTFSEVWSAPLVPPFVWERFGDKP